MRPASELWGSSCPWPWSPDGLSGRSRAGSRSRARRVCANPGSAVLRGTLVPRHTRCDLTAPTRVRAFSSGVTRHRAPMVAKPDAVAGFGGASADGSIPFARACKSPTGFLPAHLTCQTASLDDRDVVTVAEVDPNPLGRGTGGPSASLARHHAFRAVELRDADARPSRARTRPLDLDRMPPTGWTAAVDPLPGRCMERHSTWSRRACPSRRTRTDTRRAFDAPVDDAMRARRRRPREQRRCASRSPRALQRRRPSPQALRRPCALRAERESLASRHPTRAVNAQTLRLRCRTSSSVCTV